VTPTRTERVLRLFTDVRPGEGATALLMFANVFLILCAYYFVKPLREGWIAVSSIASLSPMEIKAYSSFCQSLLLLAAVSGYGRLAERLPRGDLVTGATLFAMSNLLLFWLLQPGFFVDHLPGTGIAFYLWVGMFGVFIVAQFWAFAADLYEEESGGRLIPLIALGATAGAASGAWLTERIVGSGLLSSHSLLLAALVPLSLSVLLTRMADRRGAHTRARGTGGPREAPVAATHVRSALGVVVESRYLLAVAGVTLLLNWVNTNGENLLVGVVQESLSAHARENGITDAASILEFTREGTTAFYGSFFFWVNASALMLQAFVASRLLRYGGFGPLLLILPVVALMSYSIMAWLPVLAIVKVMKIAENSTDYSINNTARHVLWLPVAAEDKYKGKPTIDSLFARIGDGLAALTVLVGVQLLALNTSQFFAFTVALVVFWLALAVVVVREHGALTAHSPPAGR
jgi:AAA family ATP:ADP antiporter